MKYCHNKYCIQESEEDNRMAKINSALNELRIQFASMEVLHLVNNYIALSKTREKLLNEDV